MRTSLNGDFTQTNYSPAYGEDQTASYKIWNLSADYSFSLGKFKPVFQVGAENLLNEYYSTYADWGNIPRMGRNIFTSLKVNF
ncbi:TonB-dependent receptor [Sphingobacterium sp. E70]|uniref:TonB-dependent receptor n=1 Tax=Sphingobacterium sp. E70 TaxID=2853439 RepID=UPI00211D14F8|nr:TonB-dependent receptor [Sphingobacterium sp. E70]ULT27978.1 TonB-dependent receptor [Sphingobacterium sp. E70]